MIKVIILPFAERDIRDSVNNYANKEEGLEKKYLKVINHSFQLISENPLSFPIVRHKIRKLAIKDFPFNIFYVFENDSIYILAIFHTKRNPKVWKTRKLR